MRLVSVSSRAGVSRGLDVDIYTISTDLGWHCETFKGFFNVERMENIYQSILMSDALILDFLAYEAYTFQIAGIAQGLGKPVLIIIDVNAQFPQPFMYKYAKVLFIDRHSGTIFLKSSISEYLKDAKRDSIKAIDAFDNVSIDIDLIKASDFNHIVKRYIDNLSLRHIPLPLIRTPFGKSGGMLQKDKDHRIIYFSTARQLSKSDKNFEEVSAELTRILTLDKGIKEVYFFNKDKQEDYILHELRILLPKVDLKIIGANSIANYIKSDEGLRSEFTRVMDFKSGMRILEGRSKEVQAIKELLVKEKETPKIKNPLADEEETWHKISLIVAHKIGNPINAIETDSSNALTLVSKGEYGERLVGIIKRIKDTTLDAKTILQQFKVASEAFSVKPEPQSISDFAKHIRQYFSNRYNISVNYDNGKAVFDRQKLKECIEELVSNSVNCNGDSVRISIQFENLDNEFIIKYTDVGIGIAEDRKEEIYDMWSTFRKGGSGMGLWTVRRIVGSHGGFIREIGDQGEGVKFVISLPLLGKGG